MTRPLVSGNLSPDAGQESPRLVEVWFRGVNLSEDAALDDLVDYGDLLVREEEPLLQLPAADFAPDVALQEARMLIKVSFDDGVDAPLLGWQSVNSTLSLLRC